MDKNYNNLRGIEQFKNKLGVSLQKLGFSQDDVDTCISKAVEKFGDKIGVMPVDGMVSAITTVATLINTLQAFESHSVDAFTQVIETHSTEAVSNVADSAHNHRLSNHDIRDTGTANNAALSGVAQEIHDNVETEDELVTVIAYNFDGTPAKQFSVSQIDMIDYVEAEDLTDEGLRKRGFLPSDFDSTDVLTTSEVSEGTSRTIGAYGHDADGDIFIQCSACNSKDAVPIGAGTYMCLTCDTTFDVDLLLDDLNPETN